MCEAFFHVSLDWGITEGDDIIQTISRIQWLMSIHGSVPRGLSIEMSKQAKDCSTEMSSFVGSKASF